MRSLALALAIICSASSVSALSLPQTMKPELLASFWNIVDYVEEILPGEHFIPKDVFGGDRDAGDDANAFIVGLPQHHLFFVVQGEFDNDRERPAKLLRTDHFKCVDFASLDDRTRSVLTIHNKANDYTPSDLESRRLARVENSARYHYFIFVDKCDLRSLYRQIASNLSLPNSLGFFDSVLSSLCARLSMVGSFLSEEGRCYGRSEREGTYQRTKGAEEPSSICRTLSSIGSFPLGAKIGGTVALAMIAWLYQIRGSIGLTRGGRNIPK